MIFRISLFDTVMIFHYLNHKGKPYHTDIMIDKTKTTVLQGQTYRETDRQFWTPMKHARHSTDITPTPGSVLINEDGIGS
jgi:hypothetical protein